MQLPVLSLRENALLYIAKLITGSIIVWYGLRAFGIAEPIWAMLSLIVVTEPDVTIAKNNFRARVINTLNGTVVACLALLVFGASFVAMLVAMTVSVLIAMSLQHYPTNWRLAPNTTVVLMSAALSGAVLSEEMRLAMVRVLEVMTGSTVALLQTLAYGFLLRRWRA